MAKKRTKRAKKPSYTKTKARVTVHKIGARSFRVPAKSKYSSAHGVAISNPAKRRKSAKRGFLRSNPGSLMGAFGVDKLLTAAAAIVGGLATIFAVPKLAALAPTSFADTAKKYQGVVALGAGLLGQHVVANPKVKAGLLGVATVGGVDLGLKLFGSAIGSSATLLAGDEYDIGLYGSGMEVGGHAMGGYEVGGDIPMNELGQPMDFSMAGLDLTAL